MKDQHRGDDLGLGFFIGLLVGAAMALVLAPQSGEATRKKIVDCATEIKDSAEEILDRAKTELEETTVRVESAFGDREKTIRKKIDELRSELEKYNLGEA
ncbi:MAG: YtxH domain-containing protein [Actinobacteria bacterium]|nr:YtxH domain-containing protein [Actinomycetota bacterium]